MAVEHPSGGKDPIKDVVGAVEGPLGAARRLVRQAIGGGQPRKRCMPTGGGFEVIVDNACCGSAANGWNGPNAHLYETGGMRRVHLRGHPNILKRCSCTSVASTSGCSCGS